MAAARPAHGQDHSARLFLLLDVNFLQRRTLGPVIRFVPFDRGQQRQQPLALDRRDRMDKAVATAVKTDLQTSAPVIDGSQQNGRFGAEWIGVQ